MILADIPVLFMVPLVIFVGFLLLILLGAITKDDIRAGLLKLKPENIKKISIIQKLDSIKLFEKKPKTPAGAAPVKENQKKPVKTGSKATGFRQHLQSLVSSISSLGTIIQNRGKNKRNIEDINKMLDRTIKEKVRSSALADAGAMTGTSDPGRSGAGSASPSDKERIHFSRYPETNLKQDCWIRWMNQIRTPRHRLVHQLHRIHLRLRAVRMAQT